MENKNNDIKLLKSTIRKMLSESTEEKIYMWYYTHLNYLKCLMKFGDSHVITKNNLLIYQNFLVEKKLERKVIHALAKNKRKVCVEEVLDFLDDLDLLAEKTYMYFLTKLEDTEVAYELDQKYRLIERKKDFLFITETKQYLKEATRILLGYTPIEDFLNYPDEYWDYIEERMLVVDGDVKDNIDIYGVCYKTDEENNITNIKIIVPRIVNLEALIINIHEHQHAFTLYQSKKELNIDYEKLAKKETYNFMKRVFVPTYNHYFK